MALGWAVWCGDSAEVLKDLPSDFFDSLVTDPPAGIGFMGKEWDRSKGGRDQWVAWLSGVMRNALRVLKPGAHGLVWALPRTAHWTAMALEDAGFELRDCAFHVFGSGFPKSLDIGKNVAGPGRTKWSGFGTALKPAVEVWHLVRKPLDGTIAANVLKHGVGGLNIDGCRIRTDENLCGGAYAQNGSERWDGSENWRLRRDQHPRRYGSSAGDAPGGFVQPSGRWPANLLLSHDQSCTSSVCATACPVAELDRQSEQDEGPSTEAGGASRFFQTFGPDDVLFRYEAKPSRDERDDGLAGFEHHGPEVTVGRVAGSAGAQNPRAGAGGINGGRNTHPTVKAVSLMRWLCRLVTPPAGVVLDPFAGSGSTGLACAMEGFAFLGIEQNPEYVAFAQARIIAAREAAGVATRQDAEKAAEKGRKVQLGLFGGNEDEISPSSRRGANASNVQRSGPSTRTQRGGS